MKRFDKTNKTLTRFMSNVATLVGRPFVFAAFFLLAIVWFIAGIFIEYDVWYDIMDVFIFLTTFFLLFVVQGSQNADTEAIQEKLDEIIDSLPQADSKKEGAEKRIKRGEQE